MNMIEDAIKELGVLPLARYCQITGEKPNAVYQRRYKGFWVVGVHLLRPQGGDWWVVLPAVKAWAAGKGESYRPILDIEQRLIDALLKRE